MTLGREPENEVPLEGIEVSRRHCRIEPLTHGGYRVVDLQSKNGTFLNGRPVSAMALEVEDQLRIGDAIVLYLEDDADPEGALARINAGTDWLPLPGRLDTGRDPDTDAEPGGTWRFQRRRPPRSHTRSLDRDSLKERLLRLGLLTKNIASAPDLSRLMDTILDEVLDFTGFERGLLLLTDDETGARLQPVIGRNIDHERLDDPERRFSRSVVEEALRERRITFRSELSAPGDSLARRESIASMGLESVLCIPLHIPQRMAGRLDDRRRRKRSRVLGAIYLDSTSSIQPLDAADLHLLDAVSAQAAIALQNARLHHQATTDPLTGLANRSFFKQVFEEELRVARSEGEELGLLMLDLDHFKRLNDTFGHDVGDEILKRVAQRVRRTIRRDDLACRWGGEELLVLLPNSDRAGTLLVADKLLEAISEQPFGEAEIKVTTSIGVAIYPEHGLSAAQLVKRADQALYAAKAAGRARVCVFAPDLDHIGHRQDPVGGLFDGDAARTHRNLKVIFDTLDVLRSSRSPREILETTLDHVCDLTRARRALLIVQEGDALRVAFARGHGRRPLGDDLRDFSASTCRKALGERRSLCFLDSEDEDGAERSTTTSIGRLGLSTVMCVPLVVNEEPVAVIYTDDTTAHREFGVNDLGQLELIGHQLALTLAATPAIYAAVGGRSIETDQNTRLREEVERLRAELDTAREALVERSAFSAQPQAKTAPLASSADV